MRHAGDSRQRGVAAIILVVFLLVVVGLALAVAMNMAASESADSGLQSDAVEALYLAESGLEYAARQLANDPTVCTTGWTETHALAAGQFQIVDLGAGFNTGFDGAALPAGQCRVRVVGRVTDSNAGRTLEAVIVAAGSTGAVNLTNASFEDDVNGDNVPDNWDLQNPPGNYYTGGAGCNGTADAVGIGYPGGTSGNQSATAGQDLMTACNVTGASDFQVDFMYRFAGATNGNNRARLRFALLPTSGGPSQSGWVDITVPTGAGCVAGSTTISVPGNRTVTRFEMYMEVRGNQNDYVVVDELQLTPLVGAGCAASTHVQSWREVIS